MNQWLLVTAAFSGLARAIVAAAEAAGCWCEQWLSCVWLSVYLFACGTSPPSSSLPLSNPLLLSLPVLPPLCRPREGVRCAVCGGRDVFGRFCAFHFRGVVSKRVWVALLSSWISECLLCVLVW